MIRIILLSALFVLLAGCSMAGPGIAQLGAAPTAGNAHETIYNSQWVKKDDSAIHDLDNSQHLSVDISEHQLGIRNRAGDGEVTGSYVPAWKQRQNARKAARQAEWKSKGGITTIREEQKQREANE